MSQSPNSPEKEQELELPATSLEAALPQESEDKTVNIVDWDEPIDAANPINWSSYKRWTHILIVAILGLIPYAYLFRPYL